MDVRKFFDEHCAPQLKPTSRTDYGIQVGHLTKYWLESGHSGPPALHDFSFALIDGAVNWQLRRGRGRGTADKLRRVGLAIWNKAVELGHLPHSPPRMKAMHERVHEPTAWSMEEFRAILDGAMRLPPPRCVSRTSRISPTVGPYPLGDWLKSLLLLDNNSGMRIGTLMAVEWSWLNLTESILRVPPDAQKDDEGQTVTLIPSTVKALENLKARATQARVFGDWTLDANQVQWPALTHRLRWAIVLGGVRSSIEAVTKRDLWHKIRRTYATNLYAKSGDIELVRELMGHSSIEVTYRYIDKTKIGRKLQAELLDDPCPPNQLRLFG